MNILRLLMSRKTVISEYPESNQLDSKSLPLSHNQANSSTSNSIPLFTIQSETKFVNISELTFLKPKPTTGIKLRKK